MKQAVIFFFYMLDTNVYLIHIVTFESSVIVWAFQIIT
jgi:hypothetical protein